MMSGFPNILKLFSKKKFLSLTWGIFDKISIWRRKNLAYRRHWISRLVRIVASIPKRTETDKKEKIIIQKCMPCVTSHVSHVKCQLSCVTCHMSHVTCHLSNFTCRLSPVTTPTATATEPPSANPPIMHSRLVHKEQKTRTNFKTLTIIETT